MARRINLADMDFDGIKANLIEFMQAQDSAVADYNYKGSAVNTIMDIMAYITHANAVNANLALNEAFLDTAQLRESVVSHAKLLGYTPRSTSAATATVNITIHGQLDQTGQPSWNAVPDGNGDMIPQIYILRKGTIVTTEFNNKSHKLSVAEDMEATPVANTWYFNDVKIIQGTWEQRQYIYDESNREKYYCYDATVDTDYIDVSVATSYQSTESVTYTKSTNIVNIGPTSNIFYLEESRQGFYEIIFGDGIIGRSLNLGNIINLGYIVVGQDNINGARTFSLNSISGNTDIIVTTVSACDGGVGRESQSSIKYNAPRAYIAQNRAVTPDDYRAILQNEYPNIQTMAVWGGEDHRPPEYGKVYITIKPYNNENLSEDQKADILENYLKPKNVISIEPVLLDPNYIDIQLSVAFKFDPNVTNRSGSALSSLIRSALLNYDINTLQLFGGIFRHSNITKLIDDSEVSIISSVVDVRMSKDTEVAFSVPLDYKIEFNQELTTISALNNLITSNRFTYKGNICTLKDYFNTDESKTIIQIVNHNNLVINPNVGYIDVALGCIYLDNFYVEAFVEDFKSTLTILTKAASQDIKPLRNDLLRINLDSSIITSDVDTVVTGGAAGAVNYQTTQTTGGY